MPQEQTLFIQKDDSSKRDISRNILLMKCYTFKTSFASFIDKFKSQKGDLTICKRGADKFEWLVNQQTATFSLLCKFWRMGKRKAIFSLPSHRPADQRNTRIKACKFQRSYFKVYIRLEVEERRVRLFEYFLCKNCFLLSFFSIVWNTRKLLIVTSVQKKIFFSVL